MNTESITSNLSHHHHINPSSWVLLAALFLSSLSFSLSDPRITEAGLYCGTTKAPLKANYIPSFTKEMESLSQLVTNHNWGTHFVNTSGSPIPIYGFAQCFNDLSNTDCLLCYAASRTKIPRCLPSVSARIYLDGCFLRYDNYSFYAEVSDPLRDTVNCTSQHGTVVDETERLELEESVGRVVETVTNKALAKGGGFAVGEVEGVYALAQCWNTIGSDGCRECLRKAGKEVRGCLPKRDGRALNAGCYFRYSTNKFYNEDGDADGKNGLLRRGGVIVAEVLAAAAALMLTVSASYVAFTKLTRIKKENNNVGQIPSSISKSSLNYKYETLEKATDYFNSSRKIGQGGAGSVFKGILPNGKVVAVKRLIFNNRQWVDEFFNEVNLISGIEHKNLVKLLGCSIEGPESLLVYEYLPKKSLDQFIFEKNRTQILNWKQRFNIILGTAEGLAYLHEGTKIRIIHRDIKSSNVLLDENLNPKIADFGLARCFGADKSHLSTGIAGTLGYMAPEYLIRGQLTDKADVYSFGVLVLEVVSGRRNNVFREDSGSLLQTVWKLYRSNTLTEAVDPCLGDDYPATEASRVFQIGLLCTQASASLRPSMFQVVYMLLNSNEDVPTPNQPPFLNTGILDSDSSIKSYSTNSFISNALKKIGASSYSYSESSCSDGPSRSEESIVQV
ncbi:cysteine-rich receptor-like protein kinase 42 [Vigna unguiculata]|uniref:Interleukin-1 receptor-associated kinase 4 n=1 Tax=Vigna unguiculata TaxID=3917 RepID=A0A4D6NDM8_VIGUN|nr:cysteine-rich receptor-like protein kinase 42 [Vigna unguiculata]QCE10854.1 interleukin-1 receptor-associated kinase 4 [Vigna unguiculata]